MCKYHIVLEASLRIALHTCLLEESRERGGRQGRERKKDGPSSLQPKGLDRMKGAKILSLAEEMERKVEGRKRETVKKCV